MTELEYERFMWQRAAALDAAKRLMTGTPTRDDLLLFCVTFPRLAPQMRAIIGERVGAAVMLQWLDNDRPDVDDRDENLVVAHHVPDDFGISETEVELDLNRVIEIANRWKIGGTRKNIQNRAREWSRRYDAEGNWKIGRRYSFPRDEAIRFLSDLKRTTKQTIPD